MRKVRWRATARRYAPAVAFTVCAMAAALGSGAVDVGSSRAGAVAGTVPRAGSVAGSDPASDPGLSVVSSLDRWRPGRRDGSQDPITFDPGAGTDGTGELPAGVAAAADAGAVGAPAWAPSTPLPVAAPEGRPVIVVLSPHPDDETLTFGPWITEAVSRGDRVVLVALTDGRSTGAIGTVSTRLGRTLTRDEIAAARLRELHQAATALGIAPSDVYRARLDDDAGPGGTRITVAEAGTVVAAFAARFPDATFASMSWIAEQHPDHLDAGHALADAASTGVVRHAVFAESRLWWALSGPTTVDVLATTAADRRRLDGAVAAYELWDPAHQRYAVGWNSVHGQFTSLLADPRTRLHGPDPTPAHPTPRDHAHLS